MEDLVSIIIPVYNVERYLNECLDSVINQTYENIEIICINDGSTDDSCHILQMYSEKDSRIRIVNKENGGLSDARNAGLNICRGEYIFLLDSDDYIHTDTIRRLVVTAKKNNADITVANFKNFQDGIVLDSNEGEELCNIDYIASGPSVYEKAFDHKYILCNVAWGKLYRRYLFNGIRYPVGKINEDEYVTYKLMMSATVAVVLKDTLYFYRSRKGSIVNSEVTIRNLDILGAFEERSLYMEEHANRYLYRSCVNLYLGQIAIMYSKFSDKNIKKRLHGLYAKGF